MSFPPVKRADSFQADASTSPSPCGVSSPNVIWEDLDTVNVLTTALNHSCSPTSQNFILDFNDSTAQIAFDVLAGSIDSLLGGDERSHSQNTRWINVFRPHNQLNTLEAIARHYDFSPRLLALMCSAPRQASGRFDHGEVAAVQAASSSDLESCASPSQVAASDLASLRSTDAARTGNLYDIIDELWHYTSVDLGRQYVCLGYNSLYSTVVGPAQSGRMLHSVDEDVRHLPHVKRVWTWLLLCEDKTVISIHEDVFPFAEPMLSEAQMAVMLDTRRNLLNVVQFLSKVELGSEKMQSPLRMLPLRQRLGDTVEESAHRESGAPGLLFYYLFENWFNSFSLVSRRASRYGLELDRIRKEIRKRPRVCHIDQLDQIGVELGVLKRHYQAYLRLIDRAIEPSKVSVASLANSKVASKASRETFKDANGSVVLEGAMSALVTEANSMLGVSLSSAARARFERLRDMIDLYALSEAEDYLQQKDGLMQMNYQLIAIKELDTVDRLTRVALLISKATILFLPVTFMTSYFSSDFGSPFTVKTYWITFAIVLLLSWLILIVFGVVSGTMESWTFYPPLKRGVGKIRAALRGKTLV